MVSVEVAEIFLQMFKHRQQVRSVDYLLNEARKPCGHRFLRAPTILTHMIEEDGYLFVDQIKHTLHGPRPGSTVYLGMTPEGANLWLEICSPNEDDEYDDGEFPDEDEDDDTVRPNAVTADSLDSETQENLS